MASETEFFNRIGRFLPFATGFSESIEWLLLVNADMQASVDKPKVYK
jgi:hypothetical protein